MGSGLRDGRDRPSNVGVRALADSVGLMAGYFLDAWLGDPRHWHPVGAYGRVAGALERRMWAPERRAGLRYTAIAVGVPVGLAGIVSLGTRRRPLARAATMALVTWTVLGGRSLRREAAAMTDALDKGDLSAARARLPHLCGRDPSTLDSDELARATVESVAENT